MPQTQLMQLAKSGDLDTFETRCLEHLSAGVLSLPDLVEPFQQLEQSGKSGRAATLAQMILENASTADHPAAALAILRVALVAAPDNAALRQAAVALYQQLFGDRPGFEATLAASGLAGGRPVRTALKIMDLCLALNRGDPLISRVDDRVVEVTEIDRENGLFTLRRDARVTTLPCADLAREYDRIDPNDFRALRQLQPARLTEMLETEPVAVAVGLIKAHGRSITAEQLKDELVPRHIAAGDWSGWWTKARAALKRSPNVTIEGRAPVILSYNSTARTLEEETWNAFSAQGEPGKWLGLAEAYLREKADRKEPPGDALLDRMCAHLEAQVAAVRARRPSEALAAALVLDAIRAKRGAPPTEADSAAVAVLSAAPHVANLIAALPDDGMWERALVALRMARPHDWLDEALKLLPLASSAMLDWIAAEAVAGGRGDAVQTFIDSGLQDLAHHPELVHWLWKGTKGLANLGVPPASTLFSSMLETLSALGRTSVADAGTVKEFRARVKAALQLKDYALVNECLKQATPAAAITIRRHLERLEGLGDNARTRMLDLLRDAHPQLWIEKRVQLAPWEDPDTVWATAEGLRRRTADRDDIQNVQMKENARRIGEAAALGDLSENSEYKFALEERDLLRARLARVNDELSRVRLIEPGDVPTEHVGVGSRVLLRNAQNGEQRRVTFLGPFETDVEKGFYSYQAPMSRKVMGLHVGETVALALDGAEAPFEILAIENALSS